MKDVLLVWGDKDQVFPLEMAKDLQGYVRSLYYLLFLFFYSDPFYSFLSSTFEVKSLRLVK
jgi:hypothetical protein